MARRLGDACTPTHRVHGRSSMAESHSAAGTSLEPLGRGARCMHGQALKYLSGQVFGMRFATEGSMAKRDKVNGTAGPPGGEAIFGESRLVIRKCKVCEWE